MRLFRLLLVLLLSLSLASFYGCSSDDNKDDDSFEDTDAGDDSDAGDDGDDGDSGDDDTGDGDSGDDDTGDDGDESPSLGDLIAQHCEPICLGSIQCEHAEENQDLADCVAHCSALINQIAQDHTEDCAVAEIEVMACIYEQSCEEADIYLDDPLLIDSTFACYESWNNVHDQCGLFNEAKVTREICDTWSVCESEDESDRQEEWDECLTELHSAIHHATATSEVCYDTTINLLQCLDGLDCDGIEDYRSGLLCSDEFEAMQTNCLPDFRDLAEQACSQSCIENHLCSGEGDQGDLSADELGLCIDQCVANYEGLQEESLECAYAAMSAFTCISDSPCEDEPVYSLVPWLVDENYTCYNQWNEYIDECGLRNKRELIIDFCSHEDCLELMYLSGETCFDEIGSVFDASIYEESEACTSILADYIQCIVGCTAESEAACHDEHVDNLVLHCPGLGK